MNTKQEKINKALEIAKRFISNEDFYYRFINTIPLLSNPVKNRFIKKDLDSILQELKKYLKNNAYGKITTEIIDLIDFLEDEMIVLDKSMQDSKCNPFRAMKL